MLTQASPNINSTCCRHQARLPAYCIRCQQQVIGVALWGPTKAAPGPEQRGRTISLLAGVPRHARRFVQRRCWVRHAKQQQPILVVQCCNGGRSAKSSNQQPASQPANQPASKMGSLRLTNKWTDRLLTCQIKQPWWRCRCHVTAARGNGPFRGT